jgi:hypothetical protein
MYNMTGHFLQSQHFGFPIQMSILCMCILKVQWPASFPISSQTFTNLDTNLGAMVGQMLTFIGNTNNRCTTLYCKDFTVTMETYTSCSQESNDYNTVFV